MPEHFALETNIISQLSHAICRPNNAQNAVRPLPNAIEIHLPLKLALCIGDLCHTLYVDLTMHQMQFGVYQTLLKLIRQLNSALCIGDLCHSPYVDLTTHKMQFGVCQTLLQFVRLLKSALCIGDLCHSPYVDLTTHKMQFGVCQTLL